MIRPPRYFWPLIVYSAGAVLLVGWLSSSADRSVQEYEFRERLLETEARLREGSRWVGEQKPAVEELRAVATMARELASDSGAPPLVREQAAAIWAIYSDRDDLTVALEPLLPAPDARTALGKLLAAGPEGWSGVGPLEGDRLVSPWLRSRLDAFAQGDEGLRDDGPHASAERPYLARAFGFIAFNLLVGAGGVILLLAAPLVWRRVSNPGLDAELATPWMDEGWVPWTVLAAWFSATVTAELVVAVLAGVFPALWTLSAWTHFVLQVLTGCYALWFMSGFVHDHRPRTLRELLDDLRCSLEPLEGSKWGLFGWGFGGFAAAVPLVFVAERVQRALPIDYDAITHPVLPELVSSGDPTGLPLLLCTITVLAPVFEECVFRGFLFRWLRIRIGSGRAVFGSALVFAAIHFSMATFMPLLALGVVLASITERSGSLLPAMVAHGLWNASTVLGVVVLYGA